MAGNLQDYGAKHKYTGSSSIVRSFSPMLANFFYLCWAFGFGYINSLQYTIVAAPERSVSKLGRLRVTQRISP